MWVLWLNPMTANFERRSPVAWAETKEALDRFVAAEKVEAYKDGPWHKVFRQGGPLEWFNPPEGIFLEGSYENAGTLDAAINSTVARWNEFRSRTPCVG